MIFFSIIIPVYNRPDELDELLETIRKQNYTHFEAIIIEDGSNLKCDKIVEKYQTKIDITYYFQENTGQGFARNLGLEKGKGNYFIILDSDALVEPNYLFEIEKAIKAQSLDLFGGPDKDHPSFSPIQKAISYAMTSVFTTGGIRGSKKNLGGTFHPRSFNMGFSRKLYNKIGGFKITRMGEDIELSIRAINNGFKSELIPEAYIYHKRRTSFTQFYKQLFFFGRARINIYRFFPKELKLVHFFPMIFTLGWISIILLYFISKPLFILASILFGIYKSAIFIDSYSKSKSLNIAYNAFVGNI